MRNSSLLLLAFSVSAFADCIPIQGDRILGRDLALADARFSALPATQTMGYAPTPGTKRIFAAAEVARIARANGISMADPSEFCFEIPLHQISIEEAARAMRRSLPAEADLTIVELSKPDVPTGELDFPIASLEPCAPTDHGVQLWRGSVKYAGTRRLPVWARVRVTESLNAVVATRDLPENVPIDASALRMEIHTGPIQHCKVALSLEDVLGRVPKRAVKAGSPIPLELLNSAPDVRRGDAVKVEVRSGPARLLFDAVAEREARNGDMIELRNPSNGRIFRARLENSKAVIVIGAVNDSAGANEGGAATVAAPDQPAGKQL